MCVDWQCVLLFLVHELVQVSDAVQNVPVTNLRFLYDGRRLGDYETPKEVQLFYVHCTFVISDIHSQNGSLLLINFHSCINSKCMCIILDINC